MKAETDSPQATLERRHQAAGNILALRRCGFFDGGSGFDGIPHSRGDRPIERQRAEAYAPLAACFAGCP